jgi:hypothetical protein
MNTDSIMVPDCNICLGAHDEEIHDATLNVLRWFGREVTKHFEDYEDFDDCEYYLVEEPVVQVTVSAA